MWGFNVTVQDFPYDNRPVSPMRGKSFSEWWFHGHLGFPPHPGDVFELPAGRPATAEIACHKTYTSYWASSESLSDGQDGNNPCVGSPSITYHSHDISQVAGCALAIAYKSDVNQVTPEDFTVFSVNHTCVWSRFTDFHVPERMPPCPEGGCTCAFFWIHSEKGGGEENYMNGFKCDVTGAADNAGVQVAQSRVPRRCGSDVERNKPEASPGNCTYGAKTPFYWVQNERNNMFEHPHGPPQYNDLYGFVDGAQEDIFTDSYVGTVPDPAPGAPIPTLRTAFNAASTTNSPAPSSTSPPPLSTPGSSIPMSKSKGICRPRFQSTSKAQNSRRQVDDVPNCGDFLQSRSLSDFAGKIYSFSKRGRRGVHPNEAHKLWKFW